MKLDAITEFQKAMAPWQGGSSKLWHYQSSFQRLVIRVEKTGVPGNLHIVCSPCQSIRAPVYWSNIDLHAEVLSEDPTIGPTYSLADQVAEVEIICHGLTTARNVPPVFT